MIIEEKDVVLRNDFRTSSLVTTNDERLIVFSRGGSNKIAAYSTDTRDLVHELTTDDGEVCHYLWEARDSEIIYGITSTTIYRYSFQDRPKQEKEAELPELCWDSSLIKPQNEITDPKYIFFVSQATTLLSRLNLKNGKRRPLVRISARNNFASNAELLVAVSIPKREDHINGTIVFYTNNLDMKWTFPLKEEERCRVTAVAVHPEEVLAATGDVSGMIKVWRPGARNARSDEGNSSFFFATILHWHSLPVLSLKWDPLAPYLYSGGSEEVLIKWNPNSTKGSVGVVPRLGAPISRIFLSDKFLVMAMANNSIKFLFVSNLANAFSLSGVNMSDEDLEGLKWFSPLNSVVLSNDSNAQLQFIDPKVKKEVMRLEVAQQNKITGNRKPIPDQTIKTKFDISSDSLWLATARPQALFKTIDLSIWKFCSSQGQFSLTTLIKEPFEGEDDNISVKFINNDGLVLLGSEGKVKIWGKAESGNNWIWVKSLTYKNLKPSTVAASEDGSVLAIGFSGGIVTLWKNSNNFKLITVLHSSYLQNNVTSVLFGKGYDSNFVFVTDRTTLAMWDLLTVTLVWKMTSFKNPILHEIPGQRFVAVSDDDNRVVLVDKHRKIAKMDSSSKVDSLVFMRNSDNVISGLAAKKERGISQIVFKEEEKMVHHQETKKTEEPRREDYLPGSGITSKGRIIQHKDPYLTFENIESPLSAFAANFIQKSVSVYKDTFFSQ